MAQYKATVKGSRGEASRLGDRKNGISADVNGWDVGVRVYACYDAEKGDVISVYLTGGSHAKVSPTFIGTYSKSDLLQIAEIPGRTVGVQVPRETQ